MRHNGYVPCRIAIGENREHTHSNGCCMHNSIACIRIPPVFLLFELVIGDVRLARTDQLK